MKLCLLLGCNFIVVEIVGFGFLLGFFFPTTGYSLSSITQGLARTDIIVCWMDEWVWYQK